MLQKYEHTVEVVQVIQLEPEKFTHHILGMSWVIVRSDPLKVARSCGNGTLNDHVAVDQVVQAEQSVVTGESNVIPVLFQQSQTLDIVQALQSIIDTSWKSTFE